MTDDVRDPGPEAVDRLLNDLEEKVWNPTDVARAARRLRAHILALRAQSANADVTDDDYEALGGGNDGSRHGGSSR